MRWLSLGMMHRPELNVGGLRLVQEIDNGARFVPGTGWNFQPDESRG